jgi:Ras-related protein Rab-1A
MLDHRKCKKTIDGKIVQLLIKATSAQLPPEKNYLDYKEKDGFIVVYDITSSESFDHVQQWLKDIDQYAENDPIILLVGNKTDLLDERQVTTETAQSFADKMSISFMETSAKESVMQNLTEEVFLNIAKEALKKKLEVSS